MTAAAVFAGPAELHVYRFFGAPRLAEGPFGFSVTFDAGARTLARDGGVITINRVAAATLSQNVKVRDLGNMARR